ncbi:Arylsulfatase A [Paenibacillus sp. 1_12]|uniref:sulfatase-like hydrolase/transferase n=1 Tax=Paenibacillus sp. 1_12 TaxID=1566278 RepID=UPI0008DEF640|nr:sulfatase-like hydrolase/transferase [Paenibacillus sp. 1_12]SFK97368.1 Arylsulfatase A [Paenibacillus sp. 1_12]
MKSPNILFIMLDQLRYDCVGYSGAYPVHTPHIDRLASEGVWFSNAFTPIPICCPSRQALINGRRPETFGALWNFKNGLRISALEPEEYAWPRELHKLDYTNVFLGKWDVHPELSPLAYGYDSYTGFDGYKEMLAQAYPNVRYEAGYFGERDPVPVEHSKTHWLADQACATIRELEGGDQPWYIQLNFTEPHLPCRPSGRFADMYHPEDIPIWGSFNETFANKPYIQKQQLHSWQIQDFTWEEWAPIVARYYGVISQADDAIGKVLQELEQSNAADRTIVIFTSDHGDMCGSHRMIDKHYVLYDDVVKIPLIIKYPGMTGQGRVCEQFVYNMLDLPPTLLEDLQLPIPTFFHGSSLMPLLNQEPVPDWRKEVVSTYNGQQFGLYTQRMLRTDSWKYIWNTTDIDELYDLEQDPHELNNLIHDPGCSELIKTYRRTLYERLSAEGDGLVQSEWMRNQLLHNNKL